MLEDVKLRSGFCSWVAGECRVMSRKRNRLALAQTFMLKAGGSNRSSLELTSRSFRFVLFSLHVSSSAVAPASTSHRSLARLVPKAATKLDEVLAVDSSPRLHWIDNYAKHYA